MQPNILIGFPAYGGENKVATTISLMKLHSAFLSAKIDHSLMPLTKHGIDNARNVFASTVLANKKYSHLLQFDDDMGFEPQSVMTMIAARKPFVGCVCPKKTFNIARALELAAQGATAQSAIAKAFEFAVDLPKGLSQLRVTDGLIKVDGIGFGLTLISRDVFETMAETGKIRATLNHPYEEVGLKTPLFGFFDQIKTDAEEVSEDFSFCRRWRELCGGDVWALVNEPITHIGDFEYSCNYLTALGATTA